MSTVERDVEDGTTRGSGLRGSLGTLGVLFAVLAYNGPLGVVVGYVPVIISTGGLGAPMLFVGGGILLTLFAVGFLAMGKHMTNPGAFYSYVTAGLGRPAGVSASFVAIFAYAFMLVGVYAYAGIMLPAFVSGTLNGPDIPWWVCALGYAVVVSTLGYFSIEISAKVLGILLIAELAIIVLIDLVVAGRVGPSNFDYAVFTPSNWTSGSFGLSLLFVMLCFGGFEATAVFREEVKDPDRTIPRATYLTVAVIALCFSISAWMLINGFGHSVAPGADAIIAATGADPTGTVYANVDTYLGGWALDVVNVLVLTSIFAATLAVHNVLTRYLFNLGVDSVLPHHLGRIHQRHGSPHLASMAVSAVALSSLVVLAIAVDDPTTLYVALTGVCGYAILVLLFATAIAILVYLNRHAADGVSVWARLVAPGLATVGLGASVVLATQNMGLLVGSDTKGNVCLVALAVTAIAGAGLGLYCRARRPDVYARIGRQ